MERASWWDIAELEVYRIPRRLGGAVGWVLYAATLFLLGVLPAWYLGPRYADPPLLFFYGCISALFVGPMIAQAYAGEEEQRHLRNRPVRGPADGALVWGKAATAAFYGWISASLAWTAGWLTALLTVPAGAVVPPPAALLAACGVWGLAVALLTSAVGGAVAVDARNPREARRNLRYGFFFLLMLFLFGSRFYPRVFRGIFNLDMGPGEVIRLALWSSAIALLLSLLFFYITAKRLPEPPLRLFGDDPA